MNEIFIDMHSKQGLLTARWEKEREREISKLTFDSSFAYNYGCQLKFVSCRFVFFLNTLSQISYKTQLELLSIISCEHHKVSKIIDWYLNVNRLFLHSFKLFHRLYYIYSITTSHLLSSLLYFDAFYIPMNLPF
jgi:hypothetical protein